MARWTGDIRTPDRSSNTLVLTPSVNLESGSKLDRLLRSSFTRTVTSVLVISDAGSSTEILNEWRTRISELPTNFAIISLDDPDGASSHRSSTSDIDGISVTSIPVSDLSSIASSVDEYLTEWGSTPVSLLWFDSITTLVQTTSLETSFRFLHLLTKQVQSTGWIAYYRLDPTAHDRKAVSLLTPLFDLVLE